MRRTQPTAGSLLTAGLVMAGIGAALLAQAPAPARPQPQGSQEAPTFRVTVDLVTNDVIVRDDKGQFIPDLTKDDFLILEDGVRQAITSMTLVHGGRVTNVLEPPPAAPQEGIILPAARRNNDVSGRIFVLVVDDLHFQFQTTGRVREIFKKMTTELIHDGDLWGMVSTGTSSISIDLNYDRSRLHQAIEKIAGSELKPTEIINGSEGANGPTEVRHRAHVAFATVTELLQNLEKVHNRRKAVIYVSGGYDFDPFASARLGGDGRGFFTARQNARSTASDPSHLNDPSRMGQRFADADLAFELTELTRIANRANATIYTIDPRGLVSPIGDIEENVDPQEWARFVFKSQDSLRVIAEETGGIAIVNQNNFDKALKRIDAETSDYYVLGYYSTNPDPGKKTRRIDVSVNRTGASVYSRKGYSVRQPPPASSTR